MKLDSIKQVYFVGIGGIGMSAIARFFMQQGIQVNGYDRTCTALTKQLEQEGAGIIYKDAETALAKQLNTLKRKLAKSSSLVVTTPAIPADGNILNYFEVNGYNIKKRAEVLGILSRHFYSIAIAGTHGKTTTSSLVAHLLKTAKADVLAFLGGIATNFNSNYVPAASEYPFAVLEADEFDRSFLHLSPQTAVITSTDADHLDIYGNAEHVTEGFQAFSKRLPDNGTLIVKKELSPLFSRPHFTYSITGLADFEGFNIRVKDGEFVFDLRYGSTTLKNLHLGMPGRHNVENAVAACAVCFSLGASTASVRKGLASFRGVKRRFEYIVNTKKVSYIDDYAHHPAELQAAVESARLMHPGRHLTGIFQPHLFTRTRDFADGFAQSLSLLDRVILLPIYPAREKPLKGINSELLLQKITCKDKTLVTKENLIEHLKKLRKTDVLMTLGAGDIDTLVTPLAMLLKPQ